MQARERLLRALQHKELDRIPLDLGGSNPGVDTIKRGLNGEIWRLFPRLRFYR